MEGREEDRERGDQVGGDSKQKGERVDVHLGG